MTVMNTSHLQPLSMGQVLDRAIRLYRQNFFAFVGIVAVVQIISSVAMILLTYVQTEQMYAYMGNELLPIISGFFAIILLIISGILYQIASAALTRAVADNYLGKPISIREAYRKIGRSWLTLIGAYFLIGIIFFALILFSMIPVVGWFLAIIVAIPGVGALMFFSLTVFPFMAPVIVLEKKKATEAPGRAWSLARRRFWWLFGFALLLTLFGQIIVTGPTYLVTLLTTELIFDSSVNPLTASIIQQLITFLFSIIYYPLQLTCITLLYFDVRIRTEGFDLAMLVKSDEITSTDHIDFVLETTQTNEKARPSLEELGYFVLISIGTVALILLLSFSMVSLSALLLPTLSGF